MDSRTQQSSRSIININDGVLVRHRCRPRSLAAIVVNVIGSETIPGFVYGIVITEAILFFSFGLNQWLQYRGVGRWNDYLYGEKVYLVLSLVAKSVLAWFIYFGSLAN